MKQKTDPSTKPYYRCLSCPNFRKTCGGRPTRDMDLKNWCEYIRDVMDHFHLTISYVSEKADVSQKRIELIRAVREEQDIMRATARRIEQVVLGPATNHLCDMDFDATSTSAQITAMQEELAATRKDRDRLAKIIDRFFDV
jgi:transposase